MAQRLWARREDFQPSARGARWRSAGDSDRRAGFDFEHAQSREWGRSAETGLAAAVAGWDGHDAGAYGRLGIDLPCADAYRAVLSRCGDCHSCGARGVRDDFRKSLGANDSGRRVHGVCHADAVDFSALSGDAEAGAGVSAHHAHGANGVSAAGNCAGLDFGFVRAARATLGEVADSGGLRLGVSGSVSGGAVAFRDFSGVSGLSELAFRHEVFCLFRHAEWI